MLSSQPMRPLRRFVPTPSCGAGGAGSAAGGPSPPVGPRGGVDDVERPPPDLVRQGARSSQVLDDGVEHHAEAERGKGEPEPEPPGPVERPRPQERGAPKKSTPTTSAGQSAHVGELGSAARSRWWPPGRRGSRHRQLLVRTPGRSPVDGASMTRAKGRRTSRRRSSPHPAVVSTGRRRGAEAHPPEVEVLDPRAVGPAGRRLVDGAPAPRRHLTRRPRERLSETSRGWIDDGDDEPGEPQGQRGGGRRPPGGRRRAVGAARARPAARAMATRPRAPGWSTRPRCPWDAGWQRSARGATISGRAAASSSLARGGFA